MRRSPTKTRLCILQTLDSSPERNHSAEQIYMALVQRGLRCSMGTIYRILEELVDAHLAQRHWRPGSIAGKSEFSAPVGAGADHLLIFVCAQCGEKTPARNSNLEEILKRHAHGLGVQLLSGSELPVICRVCSHPGVTALA